MQNMLHVGKGVSGSSISLFSSSLEILSMQEGISSIMPYLFQKKKRRGGGTQRFSVINLMTSSQGKSKLSDIHNKLSSLQ